MQKVLIVLPVTYDRSEVVKLDNTKYEVHFFHPQESIDKDPTEMTYGNLMADPGFLVSYIIMLKML